MMRGVATALATDVRQVFLAAATAAVDLLADARVAARWGRAGGCDGWTVGGLAAHLARTVTQTEQCLAAAAGEDGPPARPAGTTAGDYYAALPELDDPASQLSAAQREHSTAAAVTAGPAGVLAQARSSLAALRTRLPAEPSARILATPGLPLALEEYLRTRLVEICVHVEDLALSLDGDVPDLPDDAVQGAVAVLVDTAVRRHGSKAARRALARRGRDTADVGVFF
jgi:hypothetical protein